MISATVYIMRIIILALAALVSVFSCSCSAEYDDVVPCQVKLIGQCPSGETCITDTCRKICESDADCNTCCLPAEYGPDTCAPAELCQ